MQANMLGTQYDMTAMSGLSGPTMKGGGQARGMATDHGKPTGGGDMMQRYQMIENRTSMMQMIMERMLQHQQAMESTPAKQVPLMILHLLT